MRILSQGTKPAHKWIPDRRTSHPSIPPLCFLWILYACRVRREDQLHPMWQVPRDSHDLATGDVHVGRPRPNPTEDRSSPTWLFSSSSSSHTNSLPLCYSPPPPPMLSFQATVRPLAVSSRLHSPAAHIWHRNAHTAAMSDDSLDQGSSSSYGDSASQAHLGKGKGRQDSLAQSYRFPEKGMNGGPPDPFEVMALDRSATQQEVKQQCK